MKIIPFLLMLILMVQTPCFAEDTYIGTYDDSEFYLKNDYLVNTMNVISGQANVTAVITYKVAEIPHEKKLKDMQDLVFDNTVTHKEKAYKVLMHYNRIEKEWAVEIPYVEIIYSNFMTTNYKVTYSQHINSSLVCYLNSQDQSDIKHIDTFNAVLKLLRSDMKKYYKWTYDGK